MKHGISAHDPIKDWRDIERWMRRLNTFPRPPWPWEDAGRARVYASSAMAMIAKESGLSTEEQYVFAAQWKRLDIATAVRLQTGEDAEY
jgi:hypothetical protein